MHCELLNDGSQVYAVAQYCKVIQEGTVGHLFQIDVHTSVTVAEETAQGNDYVMQLPSLTGTTVEDISHFHVQGFEVDNDNNPAPENVPTAPTPSTTSCIYLDWESNKLNPRRSNYLRKYKAVLRGFGMATKNILKVHFLHFLPVDFIKEVLPEKMSQLIAPPCLFPDLIRFLALMLLIGTPQGSSRREFWLTEDVDIFYEQFSSSIT